MTAGQKVAFSALFSIGLFGAFVYVTKTDFIPEIEKRFYTQSKVQQKKALFDLDGNGVVESKNSKGKNVI